MNALTFAAAPVEVCPVTLVSAGSSGQAEGSGETCTALVKRSSGIIYRLTSPSGKSYVGQTIQKLSNRMTIHRTCRYCCALYAAIQKYGLSNFAIEVLLDGVERGNLNALESLAIALCGSLSPSGYNLGPGGNGKIETSLETRAKISQANKGKKKPPFTAEHRANIAKAFCALSPEALKRFRDGAKRSKTKEWKKKISDSIRALPLETRSRISKAAIEARNAPGSRWREKQRANWARKSQEEIKAFQDASRRALQTREVRDRIGLAVQKINTPEHRLKLSQSAKRRCTPERVAAWVEKMKAWRERRGNETSRLAGSSCGPTA